jgi:hypothetical protein
VKHFQVEQWVDFVRNISGKSNRVVMEQHLSECAECFRTVTTLRKLQRSATADSKYQIPEYAIRSARAIFALQRPEKVRILPRVLAKLVFDSFREPLAVGVRSQQRITRQALYEAGDYSVDLRIEHERGAQTVVLVGQIINRKEPKRKMADIGVELMSGKEVLSRATSNQLGEFQMEYRPKRSLQLHVPIQQSGKRIEVRLGNLFDKS